MGSRSRKRRRAARGEAAAGSTDPAPRDDPAGGSSRTERDAARRQAAASRSRPRSRRRGTGERPPGPWGGFPLTELVVLLALVLGVAGLVVGVEEARGRTLFLAGLALGSLGGLELAVRDHFAGYRSHSTLLAAAAAAAAVIVLSVLLRLTAPGLPPAGLLLADLALGALVFTLSFFRFRGAFQRRSGGLSFR